MQTLPAAFKALAAYRQFILYAPATKIPLDYRTMRAGNPHDPALWMSADAALLNAQVYGCGVGFVFTAADPFWFLDIDRCRTATGWSLLATELCLRLPGAAVEVSQSGNGLHVIGSGRAPPHGCKDVTNHLELYTEGRYVALTGTHATGDAGRDCTAALGPLVERYFPPGVATTAADWTSAPVPQWQGPTDDDELLSRALASTSAAGAFGGRASFRQLWDADAEALGRVWPGGSDRPYDASSADAALAAHLAFWTGHDCERIKRLMERSGLAREKWNREAYLQRTILGAVARGTSVLGGRTPDAPTAAPAVTTSGPLLLASDMASHFAGCVYIEDRYLAAAPDGSLLPPAQFRASSRYGGHKFMLDDTKSTRSAWEAFTESSTYRPAWAHNLCFRPEMPPRALIEEHGKTLFNCYTPISVRSVAGDATPFLTHLAKLLPDPGDRAILLAWMASLVQNPGAKFQWAVLLQGVEGNGKSILAAILAYCVGERYSHFPNAQDISNKFNPWLENKLFVAIEEIFTSERRDVLDALKVFITNLRVEIQGKGSNQVMCDNRANFMALTNHKDAVPKTTRDRRWCALFTAQQESADLARDGMDGSYFPDLWRWLRADGFAICAGYLRTYAIPAALDPAGDCHRAPNTSTTSEAIDASRGPVEQAILEAVGAEETGFAGGWVSSHFLGQLLERRKLTFRAPLNQWDDILRGLGYIKHPALAGGRVNNPVYPDGKKSRLWVRAGSIPALNLPTPGEAAAAYATAQGQTAGAAVKPVASVRSVSG